MIVIADDITGAAEIAGIAFVQGRQVRLVCGSPVCDGTTAPNVTTVIATDTRSMTEAEAVADTRRITSRLSCRRLSITSMPMHASNLSPLNSQLSTL